MKKNIEIPSRNGLLLRGYLLGEPRILENGEPANLVVIFHGLMDSGEFPLIATQAEEYAKDGNAVLVMDFNGHGKSEGKLIDMTIGKELQDAGAILDYARSLPFVKKIFLVGHSLGGLVASMAAPEFEDEIGKLVLLAPAGQIPEQFRKGHFFGVTADPDNPPERAELFGDFVGREYMLDAQSYHPYATAAGYDGHDVLLLAGSEDAPGIRDRSMNRYAAAYESNDNRVTKIILKGAPHDFAGHEGEVVNLVLSFFREPAREEEERPS